MIKETGREVLVCHRERRRMIRKLGGRMRECRIKSSEMWARKKWDSERMEESQQEYKETQHKLKSEVAKA